MLVPEPDSDSLWMVSAGDTENDEGYAERTNWPEEAAMRCFVALKVGGTLDIPKEMAEALSE